MFFKTSTFLFNYRPEKPQISRYLSNEKKGNFVQLNVEKTELKNMQQFLCNRQISDTSQGWSKQAEAADVEEAADVAEAADVVSNLE